MRKDRLNLFLELFSLSIFLGSLAVFVVLGILVFTIVGIELTNDLPEPSRLEEIVQSSEGYRLSILTFVLLGSIPILAATLIRLFLVRPEPFPWIDCEDLSPSSQSPT